MDLLRHDRELDVGRLGSGFAFVSILILGKCILRFFNNWGYLSRELWNRMDSCGGVCILQCRRGLVLGGGFQALLNYKHT